MRLHSMVLDLIFIVSAMVFAGVLLWKGQYFEAFVCAAITGFQSDLLCLKMVAKTAREAR